MKVNHIIELALAALTTLVCGCERHLDEKRVFNYPVTVVDMPEVTGELTPVLYSEKEYPCSNFRMLGDSVMFAYRYSPQKNCFFSLIDFDSADTLAWVCRRGRAEGELLSPSPFFGIEGEYAYIADNMNAKCYKINLAESIRCKTTVVDETFELEHSTTLSPFYLSVFQNKLVCLNSMVNSRNSNLDGSPRFVVFNLSNGSCLDEFRCFGNIPYDQKLGMKGSVQHTLYFSFASNKQIGRLFFANYRSPQINYLDVNTGNIRGIRFGKAMKLSLTNPYDCFVSACSDDKRVYAIFQGIESSLNSPNNCAKLFVFDWDGNVLGLFQLDGSYFACEISGDRLFMARQDKEKLLFSLSLNDIISACNCFSGRPDALQ